MNTYCYHLKVMENGKIEIPPVPLENGKKVEIIIFPEGNFKVPELLKASESSLGFWDNPVDDEVWNNV